MVRRFLVLGVVCLALPFGSPAAAGEGMAAIHGLASDVFDKAADDYKVGLGFNLTGLYEISPLFALRGDYGIRWIEGESSLIRSPNAEPDLGGQVGELTGDLKVMPSTIDLVYRFENLSRGRFWVPYVGAGVGLYDLQAGFEDAEGNVREHNLFKLGWNARSGVNLYRTSGIIVIGEAAVHVVDTPRRWTPFYDVSIGVGMQLPAR